MAEVDYCGHATVAAAVARAFVTVIGAVVFDTMAGQVPVTTSADGEDPATGAAAAAFGGYLAAGLGPADRDLNHSPGVMT